ncbi:xanthine dehydrogenase accessory protein XdhC [Pseudogulbenkiania ferrooxidans]|uniref:Xanthine dehydrogenase accessory protein XdhC n=1 Tax=Pseudogulbenkiania ferrooxidans 2002 TaxID=279714 RepID=B9Z5X1_9NEIS|nr:xanthine dehydrogenase accessory protein XdhC [Pseudogulbenkiania ferrooxidans]EEG07968.1 xanthine dehydrogenase accessory protein XdhC [Pseudogulbenkiania ferrooxidans 2002]
MPPWLAALPALLADGDAELVSVLKVAGSAPREAGATLALNLTDSADTLGGGHLEWEAIAHARARLLSAPQAPEVLRFALGPSLGQCCGGVVWLLFERVAARERDAWRRRAEALRQGATLARALAAGAAGSDWTVETEGDSTTRLSGGADDGHWQQRYRAWRRELALFGAGHVGQALVRVLAGSDLHTRWIDQREDAFAAPLPDNVDAIVSDEPTEEVARAAPGSAYLVMTHRHDLDLELAWHILRRDDVGFFGLIGSQSKRARFEHRLAARGIAPERLGAMVCPIGLPGISAKDPPSIAIAVAAQLLRWRDSTQSTDSVGRVKAAAP